MILSTIFDPNKSFHGRETSTKLEIEYYVLGMETAPGTCGTGTAGASRTYGVVEIRGFDSCVKNTTAPATRPPAIKTCANRFFGSTSAFVLASYAATAMAVRTTILPAIMSVLGIFG